MKRLFFIITALICTMSINAQMVEIYSGDQLVSKHRIPNNGKVVFKKTPDLDITGTAKRTGEIEVNWVQLLQTTACSFLLAATATWAVSAIRVTAGATGLPRLVMMAKARASWTSCRATRTWTTNGVT